MIRNLLRRVRYLGAFAYWSAPLVVDFCAHRISPNRRRRAEPLSPEELELIERGDGAARPSSSILDLPVRVASWNICYGRNLERIAEAMRDELRADVYLLQEVDRHCRRSGCLNVAGALAERLSFDYVFGIEFQELAQQRLRTALHGQAILSRFPLSGARLIRFDHQSGEWARDPLQPRSGGRMALAADLQLGSRRLTVYNAHLESRGDETGRRLQFSQLLRAARGSDATHGVIIAGDFNTVEAAPGRPSPLIRQARRVGFTSSFCSCKGDRRTGRRVCLDWILAKGLSRVEKVACQPLRASDHEPVLVAATLGRVRDPDRVAGAERATDKK